MVITGDIRGNGEQLAQYLTALKDNSSVEILEVDGRDFADREYLQQTIMGMQLSAEMTRSKNAYYHVQLSPAIGEDINMSPEDWQLAADILAQETGYQDQRRVIVLHTKKDRVHAHVVYERYNHATGKMIDNKHSRLKANGARPIIEKALGHKATPQRNPQRRELKEAVTALWNQTNTGKEFIAAARKQGYAIAEGTGKRPFMIVDETGRAFDLVRQIDGVKTKDVRARLRHEPLQTDKEVIEEIRNRETDATGKREKQRMDHQPAAEIKAKGFAENRDMFPPDEQQRRQQKNKAAMVDFKSDSQQIIEEPQPASINEAERKQKIAAEFAANREIVKPDDAEQAELRQKIIEQQEAIRQRHRHHRRGR